jgi:hypothetical protein
MFISLITDKWDVSICRHITSHLRGQRSRGKRQPGQKRRNRERMHRRKERERNKARKEETE